MEKVFLWANETPAAGSGNQPSITPFLLNDGKVHPAVLVIPGGGYGCVCERTEGTPIARKFNELGFQAFVLDYRVFPNHWPQPQLDAMRAMKLIRANAKKWGVDPQWVASCGFSAGAHLAGSLGILCDALAASAGDEADRFSHVPDVMILCYGVLSFASWSHNGTRDKLLGENCAEAMKFSLPENVTENTPPAFLMHTVGDATVPFRNSIEFVNAMAAKQRPCELALNYWGTHGMLLGKNTLDVVEWPQQAVNFIGTLKAMKADPEYAIRYTGRYQSEQI